MEKTALPLGFGMALAQNEPAMKRFEFMTESQKETVLQQAHQVSSKREMQQLVSRLAESEAMEQQQHARTQDASGHVFSIT